MYTLQYRDANDWANGELPIVVDTAEDGVSFCEKNGYELISLKVIDENISER